MAERPGIMLYFDLLPTIEELTDNEAGQLLRSMLNYGANGAIPDFADRTMKVIWKTIQPRIDHDAQRYQKVVVPKRKYATYCREEKRAGRTPKKFDEWCDDLDPEHNGEADCSDHLISSDIKTIQLHPQQQQHLQQQNNDRDNYSSSNGAYTESVLSIPQLNKPGDCKGEGEAKDSGLPYVPMTEEEEGAARQRLLEKLSAYGKQG